HWKPDVAIWTESELWPNLILMTDHRHVPMALLNARMSLKSYHLWSRFRGTIRTLVRCFGLICPQTKEDAERFEQFGARNVHMLGNLKHDSPPLPADSKEMGSLLGQINGRHVWVASSTHQGEEEMIAEAHSKIKIQHPDVITIIVPRHPDRGSRIASRLRDAGYEVRLRSKAETIDETTDIYIADTIGELGIFYRMAGIVFIGGSLVPHGGQNPLEPARLDCALITGPHTDNFANVCAELEAKKALMRVKDIPELSATVSELMRDHEKQETLAHTALALAKDKQGVLDEVLKQLAPLMEKVTEPASQPAETSKAKNEKA
ncbi:MAG: 3-deoxy-D-manno-octulosonic acid transferase, partial [Rickettsiales bacterium]